MLSFCLFSCFFCFLISFLHIYPAVAFLCSSSTLHFFYVAKVCICFFSICRPSPVFTSTQLFKKVSASLDSENLQSVSELLFVYFAVFQELKINLNILHHRHWESFLCVCQSEKRKGKGCVRENTVDTSCGQCMCLCRVSVTERCVCQNLINCWAAFKASVYPQLSVKTSSSLCSFSANTCILFSSHHKFRFSAFWCI